MQVILKLGLIILFFQIVNAYSQMVMPPGRVSSVLDIPGLTNELDKTITNIIAGSFTGTSSGSVERIGRDAIINYPSPEAWLTTNSFVSSFVISNTGLTYVKFPYPIFKGLPFVQFMYADLPSEILLTAYITNLTTNGFYVKFYSSGDIVTNEWTIHYLAAESLNFGYYGNPTKISTLEDGTNIMLRDGTLPMTGKLTTPELQLTGDGNNKWLAGDSFGNIFWEDKVSGNLIDGNNIFMRDGIRPITGNINCGDNLITNIYTLQIKNVNNVFNDNPPNDYVLTSFTGNGVPGKGTWRKFGADVWSQYQALQSINLDGYDINNLGSLRFKSISGFLNTYKHGVYGDLFEFRFGNYSKTIISSNFAEFNQPILSISSVISNNTSYANGIILNGKLQSSAPYNAGNRFSLYSQEPIAIQKGILVGPPDVIQNYDPNIYSVSAYGGLYCVSNLWVFRDLAEVNVVTGFWDVLDSSYPVIISAKRMAIYNTPLIISKTLDILDYFKDVTEPVVAMDGNVYITNGDLRVWGNIYASGNKQFAIVNPADTNKMLYHIAVESPHPELIYRGKAILTDGKYSGNVDTLFSMTPGTFEALTDNQDIQVWNNATFDRVRGSILGANFVIECENKLANIEVSFVVYGRRKGIQYDIERVMDNNEKYEALNHIPLDSIQEYNSIKNRANTNNMYRARK